MCGVFVCVCVVCVHCIVCVCVVLYVWCVVCMVCVCVLWVAQDPLIEMKIKSYFEGRSYHKLSSIIENQVSGLCLDSGTSSKMTKCPTEIVPSKS